VATTSRDPLARKPRVRASCSPRSEAAAPLPGARLPEPADLWLHRRCAVGRTAPGVDFPVLDNPLARSGGAHHGICARARLGDYSTLFPFDAHLTSVRPRATVPTSRRSRRRTTCGPIRPMARHLRTIPGFCRHAFRERLVAGRNSVAAVKAVFERHSDTCSSFGLACTTRCPIAPRLPAVRRTGSRDRVVADAGVERVAYGSTSTCTTATACRRSSGTTRGSCGSASTRRPHLFPSPASRPTPPAGRTPGRRVNVPSSRPRPEWHAGFDATVPAALRDFRPAYHPRTQHGCTPTRTRTRWRNLLASSTAATGTPQSA